MGLAFFGLTFEIAPQVRVNLFKQLHSIVFHGKGGYDLYTVYNMPIWLRKFTLSEIQKYYDEEHKEYEKAQKGSSQNTTMVNSEGKVNTPAFLQANQQYKGKASYKP